MNIALVGTIGAGKTTALRYLEENHGYTGFKLSKSLIEKAKESGVDVEDRKSLQDFGDKLRAEHGSSMLAKFAIESCSDIETPIVFDSIRNYTELATLINTYDDLFVIGINAQSKKDMRKLLQDRDNMPNNRRLLKNLKR